MDVEGHGAGHSSTLNRHSSHSALHYHRRTLLEVSAQISELTQGLLRHAPLMFSQAPFHMLGGNLRAKGRSPSILLSSTFFGGRHDLQQLNSASGRQIPRLMSEEWATLWCRTCTPQAPDGPLKVLHGNEMRGQGAGSSYIRQVHRHHSHCPSYPESRPAWGFGLICTQ